MTEQTKPTQKDLFNRFVNIYTEIDTLNDDIKQLGEEVKEHYPELDLSNMKKVAKLKAEQKVGDGVAKANEFLEAVESYTQGWGEYDVRIC